MALHRFHGDSNLYAPQLCPILHSSFSKWQPIYIFTGILPSPIFYHVRTDFLKIYVFKLEKQLYIYQTSLCFNESILDLIKTAHFSILRQQNRNLIGIFGHWAETNICAFHTQYQCQNWPESLVGYEYFLSFLWFCLVLWLEKTNFYYIIGFNI